MTGLRSAEPAADPPVSTGQGAGAGHADGPLFTELSARRLGPVRRFFVRRPVAMDVLVMVWFGAPALIGTVLDPADGSAPGEPRFVATVVLLTLGTGALLWRRSRPVLVTTVMVVLTVGCLALVGSTQSFEMGVALGIYAVAAHRPPRVAWLVLCGADVVVAGAVWLWQEPVVGGSSGGITVGDEAPPLDAVISTMILLLILSLAAVAIGISVRNRRVHVAALVERANALARDRDQQARLARAAERSRIAREMHDVVAHSLSVMIALADGAGAALDRSPDRARAALDELSGTGRSALADMRRVLGVLANDDAPLTPQPGSTDLDELVDRFRSAGMVVRTQGLADPLPADAGLQLAVYRIVQESLTNALRHAPGSTEVSVRVRWVTGGVDVEIVDHGPAGPVPDAGGSGQGLIGMKERVSVYGGTVEAGPWQGGWRVHAALPWTEEP